MRYCVKGHQHASSAAAAGTAAGSHLIVPAQCCHPQLRQVVLAVSHQLRNDLCFVYCLIQTLQAACRAGGVQQFCSVGALGASAEDDFGGGD
jgi:hypothetical protein